jgi:hypothetical protein
MYVGLLVLDCQIGKGHSLKEKRSVLRQVSERVRQRYNVSIAEVDHRDLWQRTKLAVSYVNSDARMGQSMLNEVRKFLELDPRLAVIDSEMLQLH